jgi:PIN domain nuclease of toxin-antitoxin system
MSAPVLDTHAWVWWLHGDADRLGRREIDALDALPEESPPCVSDISLWEVATLVGLNRLDLGEPLESWLDTATRPIQIVPISVRVAAELARLPSTFHRDPADRLIVATARVLDRPVLTKDAVIRRSGLVHLWRLSSGRDTGKR